MSDYPGISGVPGGKAFPRLTRYDPEVRFLCPSILLFLNIFGSRILINFDEEGSG